MTTSRIARQVLAAGGMRGNATRVAAVLGRSDLEQLIDAVMVDREAGMAKANQRSKLIYLQVLDHRAGALAATAYAGLSEVCHHHAYELSPTAAQVAHLLDLVDTFAALSNGVSQETSTPKSTAIPRSPES